MPTTLSLVPPLEQHPARLTPEVLAELADLEALRDTACDVYDIATRELDDARRKDHSKPWRSFS